MTLIAQLFWKTALQRRAFWVLLALVLGLAVYAAVVGWVAFQTQEANHDHYRQEARQDWLSNPDKHPHRMAHYGHFAFREKEPLSLFDVGMERFLGNMIFLEAHRQNPVNFSEAGFSTGLLRFGEVSLAMLLQGLLPLLLFFLGFDSITAERERGTLALLLSQGVSWRQLLLGKMLGLARLMLVFYLPIMAATGLLVWLLPGHRSGADLLVRLGLLSLTYLLYLGLFCGLAVLVSARSATGKEALVSLIGLWLLLTLVLPRGAQALGTYLHPLPSGAAFAAAIQQDIMREGDSHNPYDPHYRALKDSVLRANGVDSVAQLPFNFSGYVMAEGERISAGIYNRHFADLQAVYARQNQFSTAVSWLNPYMAVRSLSMALAGTDYGTYLRFQQQAEAYRYELAQHMNELQIQHISNRKPGPNDKPLQISRRYWQDVPDFRYVPAPVSAVLRQEGVVLGAFLAWLGLLVLGLRRFS
jgi:ABC-2 type transport system permease protein